MWTWSDQDNGRGGKWSREVEGRAERWEVAQRVGRWSREVEAQLRSRNGQTGLRLTQVLLTEPAGAKLKYYRL